MNNKISFMRIAPFIIILNVLIAITLQAQNQPHLVIKHLPVISQGSTGTCWSFATTSFLESEIIRMGLPETDLSEMFFVYHAYHNKGEKYLMYHGNNNFGQGGQAHDVIDVLREHGLVTYDAYPGNMVNGRYRHRDLASELNDVVEDLNKDGSEKPLQEERAFNAVLLEHIGKTPDKFKHENKKTTPEEFRQQLGLNPDDYIEITSYSHHPFYEQVVLEIPDNWSHGLYYNLPLDEMMETMYYALNNGHTICWDGDTSEKTFEHKEGMADLDKKQKGKVDQEMRQETFRNRSTTDDHLMHIVGLSDNGNGEKCFYTKNSWGADSNDFGGYLNMTEDYVKLKTVALLLHKDAVPEHIAKKLGL